MASKQAATVSRDEARDLYLRIFDEFALVIKDPTDAKDAEDNSHLQPVVDAINARLDGSDQPNGEAGQTIVRDWVNSDYEVWQCFQTYDSWTREQAEAAFDAVWPTDEVEVPVPTPAPAAPSTGQCFCGCGAQVARGKQYRPGHDARHAGAVAREILALDPKVARAETIRLIDSLPTQALRDKALAQVTRGNAKQATAKPATKIALRKAPATQEPGTVIDGFVTLGNGQAQPAQRGCMEDGTLFLNINDDDDATGDWLDSEGYNSKTQTYWMKRFWIEKADAKVEAAPKARKPKRGSAVGGDGPESLKSLLTF